MPARHTVLSSAAVAELAMRHGFDACRVTRPEIEARFLANLDHWLASGYHGEMAWMAEPGRLSRRKNPRAMLAGVRSVITLAMRYSPPPYTLAQANQALGQGVIAAYAHGDDYHEVMKKRLKALARDLDRLLGPHEQRVYVDTAPVLEHALAESSGLGWQGKHSLTINRELGSYFLLGELFTTAAIAPDEPASFHCGSCTACMNLCPTNAIVAPFIVDSNRCISYLTIEYKGFIRRDLRPLIGNRIYGCDDCQMVCPWNRHARPPRPDLLNPRRENILPDLAILLQLDEAGFRRRFAKSPIKRTGRAALQRNVCIAIGNSGDGRFAPLLLDALRHDSALVRGHAAWALGRLPIADRDQVLTSLQDAIADEKDENALEEMILTIRNIRDKHDRE